MDWSKGLPIRGMGIWSSSPKESNAESEERATLFTTGFVAPAELEAAPVLLSNQSGLGEGIVIPDGWAMMEMWLILGG